MKKPNWSLALVLTLIVAWPLASQNVKSGPIHPQVEVTHAEYLGKTPPLRNLVPMDPTTPEKRSKAKENKKTTIVSNFAGRGKRNYEPKPGALPKGADPVRQGSGTRDFDVVVEPIVNIDGMNQSNFNATPPDPCGDIGSNYYIQMINATLFRVFDKEGNAIGSPISANTIWSQVGFSSAGDPIILFDQEADRWIITEFPSGNKLLVAISEDNDPFGSWDAWAFSTPSFPDYPKYSIWPNAYCVTTNEGGAGQVEVYFINRQELLANIANPTIQRITLPGVTGGPGFYVATPVDWTGMASPPADALPMILCLRDDAWGSVSQDGIEVFEVDIDWANSANTTYTTTLVATSPFDTNPCSVSGPGFSCIPQLNGGGIDGLPEVIMHQVHYRNFGGHEAMVLNFIVDATAGDDVSGIRWMELRRTGTGPWTVYQEGTFAPDDGMHRFMGGIAMDGAGNIGLAYSVSSETTYPGLRFTGRRANDPLGEMTVVEYEITTGFSAQNGSRYGDYAQMAVDPSDDRTFWFTGEYRRPSNWGTKIFSFELRRDTNDIGPSALLTPINSPDLTNSEIVQIEVKNFGVDSQFVFGVGYIVNNTPPAVVEPVNYILAPDSTYVHTFATPVDMSVVGDYEFTLFTVLPDDEAPLNDTLRIVRSKLPRFDAGITDILGVDGVGCNDPVDIQLELTNFGTEILESVTIEVIFNGAVYQNVNWTGVLQPGDFTTLSMVLTGMVGGQNEISAATSNPNGEADEIPVNDEFSRTFNAISDGVTYVLTLKTDNFPSETTWELEDANGNVLYMGGPYTQASTVHLIDLCLAEDDCYTFTIFDSEGDGICCFWGEGNYNIKNPFGNMVVNGTGVFGSSQSHNFCANLDCMLAADIDISPETNPGAGDGAILITPMNGAGPYQYSIDGGATFQSSNLFENLPAGDYDIVVTGSFDCIYEETVNIELCALSFVVEVTDESVENAGDGVIEITASGGSGQLQYSIDGGATFQSSPVFPNLFKGEYEVIAVDALGCEFSSLIEIGVSSTNGNHLVGQLILVYPNPTDGVFRIDVKGLQRKGPFLDIQIFDSKGQVVQFSNLVKYDDTFTGEVSLVVYPAGVYYVRFIDDQMHRMVRVVRQ
ncbi:MAG: T9SS type A sorting domain-containing protein [Saprospirales bacterium]|nr:T9SS type A sorting domain-containing protein [Saprospirales bacterium]